MAESPRRLKITKEAKNTKLKKVINEKEENPNFFVCCTCKRHYDKLDVNFPASQSELYAGLDYHLPICKNCIDKLFEHYTEVYGGNEDKAIERICMMFDIYYDTSLLNASRKTQKKNSRILSYISKSNLAQYKDKTYDTTLDKCKNDKITSIEQLKDDDNKNIKDIEKLQANIEEWGGGYSPEEFDLLNKHYKLLTQKMDSMDFVTETLVRDLCDIKVMQYRAKLNNDYDKFEKYIKLYQTTLSSAKLKPEGDEFSDRDTFGCWIDDIERFTPADYYKDKKNMFFDYFGIVDYITRFLFRPMKNLFLGTKEKDKEYCIDSNDGRNK